MAFKVCLLLVLAALCQGRVINPDGRIINGDDVKPGERPFQVSLQTPRGFHFCGGSIINEYYVVTAAHCTSSSRFVVVVGTLDVENNSNQHEVDKIIVHEKYTGRSWHNDIALVKVKTPFKFNDDVAAVPLVKARLPAGASVVVSGWGDTETGYPPKYLKQSTLDVVSNEYCNEVHVTVNLPIPDHDVCALNRNSPAGACYGDSGGPLTSDGKLVGIVSGGINCGDTKYPNVYTSISSFYDWIVTKIVE